MTLPFLIQCLLSAVSQFDPLPCHLEAISKLGFSVQIKTRPRINPQAYVSVVFPTWAMGKSPGTQIILSSYGSDLAKKHGRRARQIVSSIDYQAIFETTISKRTQAADFWTLENGSEYMSCGILSGITGNRADGVVLDDPIKGRAEADSETIRNKTWEA